MTQTQIPALQQWGDYDLDDPFPLFAEVLEQGPVHDITLKDGVRAFLVVSYDAAREALNHPGLSKDMEAAMDSEDGVVSEGLPGRDFARHMLSVDPPDHSRMRGLATPGFTKSRLSGLEGRIDDDRLVVAGRPRCRRRGGRPRGGLRPPAALLGDRRAARHRRRGPERSGRVVRHADGALLRQHAAARGGRRVGRDRRLPQRPRGPTPGLADRGPRRRPRALRERRRDHPQGAALVAVPAHRRRAPHHDVTDRQRRRRPPGAPRPARCAGGRPGTHPQGRRGVPALRRAGPPLHVPLRHRGRDDRRDRHPGRRAGDRQPGRGRPRPGPPSRTRTSSTYAVSRPTTWRSATASTTASARASPGSRRSSRSAACSPASPTSGWPWTRPSSTGTTATGWSCAGSRRSRSICPEARDRPALVTHRCWNIHARRPAWMRP